MNLQQWFQRLAILPGTATNAALQTNEGLNSQTISSSVGDANANVVDLECESKSNPKQSHPVDRLLLSISQSAMACEFEVLLNQSQYGQGAEQAMVALEVVSQLEQLLSVYKLRSELSTLNRFGSSRPVAISHDTLTVLDLAVDLYKLTAGAFDITAGSLSEAWGFSRRQGSVPSDKEIEEALDKVGSQHLATDGAAMTACLLREGVQVNPGGIGKGYALDRAIGRLIDNGIEHFMIHGGLSSVAARGDRQHSSTGGGWLVALKHPWRWEETLGTVRLRNQALGTSGSGKQFFHFGGKRYSHIIDPRSGWPAQEMMSVTVICPSGAVADALATALFVMGPELSQRFCDQHPEIAAILIYVDQRTGRQRIVTCNITDDIWRAESN